MAAILLGAVLLVLGIHTAGIAPGMTYGVALLLVAGWLGLELRNRRRSSTSTGLAVPLLACGFLCYLILVCIPVPDSFPRGYRRSIQEANAHSHLVAAQQLGLIQEIPPDGQSLSRNQAGSWRIVILAVCYLAAFFLAAGMSAKERRNLLAFLVCFGSLFAVAGMVSKWWIPQETYLWWYYPAGSTRSIGSFLNRSHFGGFIAILCPLAMAMCTRSVGKADYWRALGWGGCYMALCVGVLGSLSRGAFLAMIGGMALTGLLLFSKRRPTQSITILIFAFVLLAGMTLVPGEVVSSRLRTLTHAVSTESGQARLTFWREALTVWRDYPWLGVGPEGFRSVYAGYRSGTMSHMVTHVENEYVQALVDLGVIGCLIGVLLIGAFAAHLWRRRHALRVAPTMAAGLFGGLAVVFLHNALDFPIRVPLYGLLVFTLAGALCSSTRAAPELDDCPTSGRGWWQRSAAALALLLLVTLIVAKFGLRIYEDDASYALSAATPQRLAEALCWAPTQPQIWHLLALHAAELGSAEMDVWAEQALSEAVRYNPRDYRVWLDLAEVRTRLGDQPGMIQAVNAVTALRPHYEKSFAAEPPQGSQK